MKRERIKKSNLEFGTRNLIFKSSISKFKIKNSKFKKSSYLLVTILYELY